jgi:hypothetical protein
VNLTRPSRHAGMGQRPQCLKWRRRLVCSQCGGRNVDMVVASQIDREQTPE